MPVEPSTDPLSPEPSTDRYLAASIAANTRWAHEPDRAAATLPAREAFNRRFEDEVDPDRQLSPQERARRAESARKAYFMRLALKSAQSRRKAKAAPAQTAEAAETELTALGGDPGGEAA